MQIENAPFPKKRRRCPTDKRDGDFVPFDVVGRFMVCREEQWLTVDNLNSTLISHETRKDANECAQFAREYVKTHGDIDFSNFPYGFDSPLTYCRADEDDDRERAWYLDNGTSLPAFTFGATIYKAADFPRKK